MALVPFLSYTTDIAPHVDGCPTAVIAQYVRKVVIDLCERAKIWRVTLTPVTLTATVGNYALLSSVAETEVSSLLDGAQISRLSLPGVAQPIGVKTEEYVYKKFPDWPNSASAGSPGIVFRSSAAMFSTAPVPDSLDTYAVTLRAAIRPTTTAVNVEDSIMSEFKRAWFHGTVHELMMLPNRVWSNDKLALYHGKQWEFFLNNARAKVNKGFGRAALNVRQRPW